MAFEQLVKLGASVKKAFVQRLSWILESGTQRGINAGARFFFELKGERRCLTLRGVLTVELMFVDDPCPFGEPS